MTLKTNRALKLMLLSVAVALLLLPGSALSQEASGQLTIDRIERLELHIPFYSERTERHMHRARTHGERVYLYRTTLSNGVVGWGESPKDEADKIESSVGKSPFACMYDDATGYGIQMSLFDAVGKSFGVPAGRLLGAKVRDKSRIAWWAIDMPPQDWAAEIRESVRRGYRSAKLKGRPWRDIRAQVQAVSDAAPTGYRVVIDFNGFLHTPEKAIDVLRDIDGLAVVDGYESPFYAYRDPNGSIALQQAMGKPVYEHFRANLLATPAAEGFVMSPDYFGLMTSLRYDAQCAAVDKPHWIQTVGTGVMTAFSLQLAAVMTQAKLPMVTCHELYEDDLLVAPLEVDDGVIAIPDAPGLGVQVDEASIEKYRVEPGTPTPQQRFRQRTRVYRIHLGEAPGEVLEYPSEEKYFRAFRSGEHKGKGFAPGTRLESESIESSRTPRRQP
jgi:L-alanine-DL-glutamate epimerase-like enolase superfamily enzyme